MSIVYQLVNEQHHDDAPKATGSGQSQTWDTSSSLGDAAGDIRFTLTTNSFVYVEPVFGTTTPTPTDRRYRFYIDTTDLTLPSPESFAIFSLRTSSQFGGPNVHLRNSSGTWQMLFQTIKDGFAFNANSFVNVAQGAHWVEIWSKRATSAVANNAITRFYVDTLSTPVATHANYDFYDDFAALDRVRVGGLTTLGPIDAGTSGSFNIGKIAIATSASPIGEYHDNRGKKHVLSRRRRKIPHA